MNRSWIWLLSFLGLVLLYVLLTPVARQAEPLLPTAASAVAARWVLRLAMVGFGAALAACPGARPRAGAAKAVLVISALLAAIVGFCPVTGSAWLRFAARPGVAEIQAALTPLARVWLGAAAYELLARRR